MAAGKSTGSERRETPGGGSRPRGEMRERILDVALELFIEQGYDKTSLREIAERLGVTKAALYYHFERKDDILLELHLRLHRLGLAALSRVDSLERPEDVAAAWPGLMSELIDTIVANQDLFTLHQRNQQAFDKLRDDPRHLAEQGDMEQRFREVLGNPAISIDQRVRMACSVGAVMMGLGARTMIGEDASSDEIANIVRDVVGQLGP